METSLSSQAFSSYLSRTNSLIIPKYLGTPCIFTLLSYQKGAIDAERRLIEVLEIQYADQPWTAEAINTSRESLAESERQYECIQAMFN